MLFLWLFSRTELDLDAAASTILDTNSVFCAGTTVPFPGHSAWLCVAAAPLPLASLLDSAGPDLPWLRITLDGAQKLVKICQQELASHQRKLFLSLPSLPPSLPP